MARAGAEFDGIAGQLGLHRRPISLCSSGAATRLTDRRTRGHASDALHNSLFHQSLAFTFSLRRSRALPISPLVFARRDGGPTL